MRLLAPRQAPSRTLPRAARGRGGGKRRAAILSAAPGAGVTLGAEDSLSREAGEGTGGGLRRRTIAEAR